MNRGTHPFRRAVALLAAVSLVAVAVPRVAGAQPSPRAEAAERFDRGVRLFNDGNNDGALAEFKRANDLVPNNAVVVYNVGLVYAAMNRPVDATAWLDRALAQPGSLSPKQLENARRVRDEQAARIAEVGVTVNVEGALIEIDNVQAGKAPLAAPIKIASGTHIVGAIAPGHAPLRKEITVAGGQRVDLDFPLVAMEGRLAHLTVKASLPAAEVLVDGQRTGQTPLAASLTLSPGQHMVELRRPGYLTAQQTIVVGDGASGEVALDPQEDRAALATEGGNLAIDASEPLAVVTVDGKPRGVYTAPLRLAHGPHHLLVERGDFEPFERDVVVPKGGTTRVAVTLEPTPEYRARYVASARRQRTWGWISIVGGLAVAGGGVGLFLYDSSQRSDGNSTIDGLVAQSGPGQRCNLSSPDFDQCKKEEANANQKISDANGRDVFAYVGMGVGAAAVALGIVLLVTNDDAGRYDRVKGATEAARAEKVKVTPIAWSVTGGGAVGVAGTF